MFFEKYAGYIYLYTAIACTVTSQLTTKWRVTNHIAAWFPMPEGMLAKLWFIIRILTDPFIIIACFLTLAGGILWIATMTKFDISYAYPFTMLGFVAVLILSALLLGEQFNIYKIIGCCIIITGVFVTSKGL